MGAQIVIDMLLVQVIAAGLQLLSRVILSEGTYIFALIAYRHIIGAIVVAPFALLRERSNEIRFTWSAFFWLFMVALIGITMGMGFFNYGLRDTTATYATNFLTLIPIVTFSFSAILRIEKLQLHTKVGNIKILGACLCFIGALTIVIYKGNVIKFSHHEVHQHHIANKYKPNWIRGTIFLTCSCISITMFFILQARLVKVFPHRYLATMLTCIIAAVQNVVIGLCIDTRKSSWSLDWNLQLITILYSGVLATAASFCLLSSAVAKRGPTYPTMFNPLSLILVAIAETIFLGQEITIGSLIGMVVIIVGLYSFLWGKNMELKNTESAALQLTAIVVPANSPITTGILAKQDNQI